MSLGTLTLTVALGFTATPAAAAARTTVAGGRTCTVVGTAGNDRLVGTSRPDVICGLGGNDVIDGRAGNDIIDGGPGNDRVSGGHGNDQINGGPGNDRLNGDAGDDKLTGGPGSDNVQGGTGINTCPRDKADTSPRYSCTDLAAPVVDVTSAEWVGDQVLDNSVEHTLTMRVRITDDRSGVGTGIIAMATQNGPTVYLDTPTLLSGTVNDGVWQFTGTLPAYAPSGPWAVVEVGVWDRVKRHALLGTPTGLPTFTVTGQGDLTAPQVDITSVEWVGDEVLDNSTERTLTMRMRITDDLTGVGKGLIAMAVEDGPTVYLDSLTLVSGDNNDGVWEFTGTLPAQAPTGVWRVVEVGVWDRAERHLLLWAPEGLPTFAVIGHGDLTAPLVDVTSAAWVGDAVLDNSTERPLTVRMRITDDLTGVARGVIAMATEGGPVVYLDSPTLVSGTVTDGVWEFSGVLPALAPTGRWKVVEVGIWDRAERHRLLWHPVGFPGFAVV